MTELSLAMSSTKERKTLIATKECPFINPTQLFEDFESCRQEETLVYSESLGAHMVTKYSDIIQVLDHPELFSSLVTVPKVPEFLEDKFEGKVPAQGTLLEWDNPDHDRLRRSVCSFFMPRHLSRFDSAIRKMASDLIDEFDQAGQADLKHAFALPLPLKIVSMITGLDPERWEWVGRSLALFGGHAAMSSGTFDEKIQGIMDTHEHVSEIIQQRKIDRRDDLISHIWNERDAGVVEMTDFEHLGMIPGDYSRVTRRRRTC